MAATTGRGRTPIKMYTAILAERQVKSNGIGKEILLSKRGIKNPRNMPNDINQGAAAWRDNTVLCGEPSKICGIRNLAVLTEEGAAE